MSAIHPRRVVLLIVVVALVALPYTLLLAVHYVDSTSEQKVQFKDERPLIVAVTVRKAMYLGSSYGVDVTLTEAPSAVISNIADETTPYKAYARRVLAKAQCKLDAPDYSVVEVKPKRELETPIMFNETNLYVPRVWECGYVVSPKVSGQPMLLIGVTNISDFEDASAYENTISIQTRVPPKLHDLHLPLNVPVEDRLSLTTISAPLAVVVALAGLFIKDADKSKADDTTGPRDGGA